MTYKYEIRMYWSDEDEAFVAVAPELPGCFADGPTREDATREIEVVMGIWIETAEEYGWEIPEAKGRRRLARV